MDGSGFWMFIVAIVGGWWAWTSTLLPIHGRYILVGVQNAASEYKENSSNHTVLEIGYESVLKTVTMNDGCVMTFTYSNLSRDKEKITVSESSSTSNSKCFGKDQVSPPTKLSEPYVFYYRKEGDYFYWTFSQMSLTEKYHAD